MQSDSSTENGQVGAHAERSVSPDGPAGQGARVDAQHGNAPRVGFLARRWRSRGVGAAELALALGLLVLLWLLARPLALLLAAIITAQALAPVVGWLERIMPRVLAVVLTYLAVAAVLGLVLWLLVPRFVAQGVQMAENAPALAVRAEALINRWAPAIQNGAPDALIDRAVDMASGWVLNLAATLVSMPLTVLSAALDVSVVVLMSIYWLLGAPALLQFVLSLFPEQRRKEVNEVLAEVSGTMGGFVRAQIIDSLLIGSLVFVGLTIIGVEYTLLLALFAALTEFIPYVGPWLAAIPAVLVALLDSPTKALIVVGFYFLMQQIESNVLMPVVMQQQARIPPVLSIFAIFGGAALGGVLGALIAIPVAGGLQVLVVRVAAPAVRRWLAEQSAEPDPTGMAPTATAEAGR